METVVVLIKPDGVARNLIGEVVRRFEQANLKVVGLKMLKAPFDILDKHYNNEEEYVTSLGKKTLKSYEDYGKDAGEEIGTTDAYEIGKMVRKWLMDYVGGGPIVAIVLGGRHAVAKARSIAGPTMPVDAPPGTIRGDLATDSPTYANLEKRGVHNLLHVSGTPEEAEFEVKLWFREEELFLE